MWMRSSRRGLEIRAMMMNPHAASIVGIGIRRTGLYVMALTGAMAGLAAVLLSQTYYIAPFSRADAADQGRLDRALRRTGFRAGRRDRGNPSRPRRGADQQIPGRSVCPDDSVPRHHPGSDGTTARHFRAGRQSTRTMSISNHRTIQALRLEKPAFRLGNGFRQC